MEFFQAFGVSWKSLFAQLVNFVVLMWILHRIAYKPLLAFMEERKKKIEQGLIDARGAKASLEHARIREKEILDEAYQKANEVVLSAHQRAEFHKNAAIEQTKKEVASVIDQGKKTIAAEREQMLASVKQDLIDLVIKSAEKVLGGAVDPTLNRQWFKEKITKLKER